jgi:integrase
MNIDYRIRKKSNGYYFIEYYDDAGARRRISCGSRTKADAVKMRDELVRGGAIPAAPTPKSPAGEMTMDELFLRCQRTIWSAGRVKSQRTLKSNLKILSPLIGDKPVKSMDYDTLLALSEELKARGYAPATVHRKLSSVGAALREATRIKGPDGERVIVGRPDMPQTASKKMRTRTLSVEEESAVFELLYLKAYAEPHRKWRLFSVLFRFLLDTGFRVGEALSLTDKHIEIIDGRVFALLRAEETKTAKPRLQPLSDEIVGELNWLRAHSGGGKLFPIKQSTMWYMWSTIRDHLRKSGTNIDDVVLHSLRHTCLTRLAKLGHPIDRIADWAGHANIATTIKYYRHLDPADKLNTLKMLENMKAGNHV